MGESVEGINPESVNEIINSVAEDISHEIQRSFDYFKATSSTPNIDRVVLTGGCSKIRGGGIAKFLTERLGVEV